MTKYTHSLTNTNTSIVEAITASNNTPKMHLLEAAHCRFLVNLINDMGKLYTCKFLRRRYNASTHEIITTLFLINK